MTIIDDINNEIWSAAESYLIPNRTEGGTDQIGVVSVLSAVWLAGVGTFVTGPLAAAQKAVLIGYRFFQPEPQTGTFEDVLKDSRVWSRYGNIEAELEEHPLGEGNPDFQYGVATCTYQDSGSVHSPDSQWASWEEKVIANVAHRSGKSANVFELYKTPEGRSQLIERLHKLGLNSYRFSVEWSHIQPTKDGLLNIDNLQAYVELCKQLRDEGIEPCVTLHHFSEPKWFHDLGSFENESHIPYFVDFAERIFKELTIDYQGQPLVKQFCTINEPAIEAFSRYIRGAFPVHSGPVYADFKRAGLFLQGAFKAHEAVYDRLKAINPTIQIGLIHQYLRFIPKNPLMLPVMKYFTHLINEVPLHYFKTGEFDLKVPFCHIYSKSEKPKLDFIGLQYYTRPVIGFGPTSYHEPMTLMPFREDPEGLYEAIVKTFEQTQKPILITENGISTRDDDQRTRYIARALFAAKQAAEKIGVQNLKGYQYWCLVRNLEWDMGMEAQDFGAYQLEKDGSIASEPKPGMAILTKVAQAFEWWKQTQKLNVA